MADQEPTVTTKLEIRAEHKDRYTAQRLADRQAELRLNKPVAEHVNLINYGGRWSVSATYVEGDLR